MDREVFFDNIAQRLGRPRQKTPPERDVRGVPDFYRQQPFGDTDPSDRVARFQDELEALGGHVDVVNHFGEVRALLQRFIIDTEPRTIITWARDVLNDWELDWLWEREGVYAATDGTPGETFREIAQEADLGITTVKHAIANTGSLVLWTTPAQPRLTSLFPTIHLALIRESQIVSRMGEALDALPQSEAQEMPSSFHFISGPSRSSDIENDLSIGVHGPVAVRAVVVRGI